MKKILNNKDLLEQFKRDKEVIPQKQLAEKYSISLSSITRLINQIKQQQSSSSQSVNQSQILEQSQSQNLNEELDSQNYQSESIQNQSNEEYPSSKNIQIQSSKSIQEIQQEEQIIDKSLINYLNKNDSIEIQKKEKRKEKIDQPIIKPQIIQQPQPIIIKKPQIQTIELQNSEDENEIQNFMIKIRKMIQFFKNQSCIHQIIGSTDFQQQQFISRLYLKNLEEIKLIHKTIQFELLFSRSNSFVQDSIESGALFIERLLLTMDINVVGCFQELQEDQEFYFSYQLMLCDNAFIASAKQIIFMKFIKNYYNKYSENKSNTSIDLKQRNKLIKNFFPIFTRLMSIQISLFSLFVLVLRIIVISHLSNVQSLFLIKNYHCYFFIIFF